MMVYRIISSYMSKRITQYIANVLIWIIDRKLNGYLTTTLPPKIAMSQSANTGP